MGEQVNQSEQNILNMLRVEADSYGVGPTKACLLRIIRAIESGTHLYKQHRPIGRGRMARVTENIPDNEET